MSPIRSAVESIFPLFFNPSKQLNALKERHYLTESEYHSLKKRVTHETLTEVVTRLYNETLIDRKHYFTFSTLLDSYNLKGTLELLYGLSALQFIDQLEPSPNLYSDLVEMANEVQVMGIFKPKQLQELAEKVSSKVSSTPAPFYQNLNRLHQAIDSYSGPVSWHESNPSYTLYTLRLLTKNLQGNEESAKSFLNRLAKRYQAELSQDLSECKKSHLLMEIAYLDRLLAKGQYVTPLAEKQLAHWLKHFPEEEARHFFVEHPDQYNWVMEMRFHHHAVYFGHSWNKLKLLLDWRHSLHLINDRMIDLSTGIEWTYGHQGLQRASDEVYKQKKRKSADWRLEIATHSESENPHSHLYLKTPSGRIYSFGKLPDNDIGTPSELIGKTVPSYIRSPDLTDLLHKKRKVTKIDLKDEVTFRKALDFVRSYQSDFNSISSNCGSLPMDLSHHLGFNPKGSVTVAGWALPLNLKTRKFLVRHKWIQLTFYPIQLITHLFMLIFGGCLKHPLAKTTLFPNLRSFVDPRTSLINYPPMLRAWQEVLEEGLGKRKYTLPELHHL